MATATAIDIITSTRITGNESENGSAHQKNITTRHPVRFFAYLGGRAVLLLRRHLRRPRLHLHLSLPLLRRKRLVSSEGAEAAAAVGVGVEMGVGVEAETKIDRGQLDFP
jgi:hypothetical protein